MRDTIEKKPAWFYTGKHAVAFIKRESHGEFIVVVKDTHGKTHTLQLAKHNLRMLTLVGTLIFTDVVGMHREVHKPALRKRSVWKRLVIAYKVLFYA